jgi:hypothetical protein
MRNLTAAPYAAKTSGLDLSFSEVVTLVCRSASSAVVLFPYLVYGELQTSAIFIEISESL